MAAADGMTPVIAAIRFGYACMVGAVLGIWYDFLRPLRPRKTALADSFFVLGALWGAVWFGFSVCRGDLRIGYLPGMGLGGVLWEMTLGRKTQGLFRYFWQAVVGFERLLMIPGKKKFEICKKNVCICEKMGYNKMVLSSAVLRWFRRKNP